MFESAWMNVIAAQFFNGNIFFPALTALILANATVALTSNRRLRSFLRPVALVCVALVAASGTPLPLWMYLTLAVLLAATWVVSGREKTNRMTLLACILAALTILEGTTMIAIELPYHLRPMISFAKDKDLYVIGDSLSMGADPPGKNWPEILGDRLGLVTHNFSFGGAKVSGALSNARRIDADQTLVLLEIGGNDILSGTPIRNFRTDLNKLLSIVSRPGHAVAMIELPLPPFFNRYGATQRALAKHYGATLIPKRYLTTVLATPGATVDGLHLSNKGHALLGEALAHLFNNGA